MRHALLLIIAVQCLFSVWSGWINPLHANESIGNAEYFWSIFIAAALMDYYCIQLLTSMKWTNRSFKYFKCLIALLALSVVSHLIGCLGFWSNAAYILQLYDTTAILLLAAELGVFVIYGLDLVRTGSIARSRLGS